MVRRALLAALGAGVIAGLVLFALQLLTTLPLIAEAELHEAAVAGHGSPPRPLVSDLVTAAADVLASVGYALLLLGVLAWRGPAGGWRGGLLWGLAGFASFSLAPALGLSPALPGSAEAALEARQLWWALAAAATAVGLWLAVFLRRHAGKALGIALIAVPHLIGAPSAEGTDAVPEEVRHAFIAAVLLTSLAHWLVLGGLAAWLFARTGGPRAGRTSRRRA